MPTNPAARTQTLNYITLAPTLTHTVGIDLESLSSTLDPRARQSLAAVAFEFTIVCSGQRLLHAVPTQKFMPSRAPLGSVCVCVCILDWGHHETRLAALRLRYRQTRDTRPIPLRAPPLNGPLTASAHVSRGLAGSRLPRAPQRVRLSQHPIGFEVSIFKWETLEAEYCKRSRATRKRLTTASTGGAV